ncbi:MAG TPA: hypothetical protein VNW28_05505 [Chthoniobacterales bacterium]|nr:hypothetical protein [Chthoniobacterales bacterium]
MSRLTKIGITVVAIVAVLPIVVIIVVVLFVCMPEFTPPQVARREIQLANHGSLIIDGKERGRSEHGFSQRAGYRPPGSAKIEWFGEVSDGVEPRVYQAGSLVVVIDLPSAQLYIRTHAVHAATEDERDREGGGVNLHHIVRPRLEENWKSLALIFPNDIGPFPISYYAEKNGLTTEEVSRINQLGGKRERKYPTTYIQSFDPETRDLKCSYQVDNKSSWPLHLRLSADGTRLALIGIGGSSP